jgi:hypothetical protein
MALDSFNYRFRDGSYLSSCSGCGAAEEGEVYLLETKPSSGVTDWPEFVEVTINKITKTPDGPVYLFTYENDDWIPSCDIRDCDIAGTKCPTCCDSLKTEQVLPALDLDGDGVIDDQFLPSTLASDVDGLCAAVISCLDTDGDGVLDALEVDASNIEGLCAATISCLDTDGNGKIDDQFLPATLAGDITGLCAAIISCLDTDGDGKIDHSFLPIATQSSVEEYLGCV